MEKLLPRFVIGKKLRSGEVAFYFNVPSRYRKQGCTMDNEALGTDYALACGDDGKGGKAASLNEQLDEWNTQRLTGLAPQGRLVRYGSVDWLFAEYKKSDAYLMKVADRSRPDYERVMLLLADHITKQGDRVGGRQIKTITPRGADKLYKLIRDGGKDGRPRQAEKLVSLCAKAWAVVYRLYPDLFDKAVPNPWEGTTKEKRTKAIKPAATRDQTYSFAWGAIEAGYPQAAAAAVICFEWLQRPENVLAGYLRWPDYRSGEHPNALKIFHHKTGAVVWHPLEENIDGEPILFYEEAEAVLATLPRLGIPMLLRTPGGGPARPYTQFAMAKLVRRLRIKLGLPAIFTLDACRHGGMTELEEAELTDGQGRALSGHRTQRAYEGYAKRTMNRALAATRRRHAYLLLNSQGTNVQNGHADSVQNEKKIGNAGIA